MRALSGRCLVNRPWKMFGQWVGCLVGNGRWFVFIALVSWLVVGQFTDSGWHGIVKPWGVGDGGGDGRVSLWVAYCSIAVLHQ